MDRLTRRMAEVAEAADAELDRLLPPPAGAQARLHEAMRYAVLGGGKRLRPFLVVAAGGLFGVPTAQAIRTGAAIELIHGYSLVHDDLPAMDDAALRRGRPTCHARFDEASAILAGDALQALAFEVLAGETTHEDPAVRCALVQGLARAAGAAGMCGGQMIDLEAEGQALALDQVLELERLKTGALIRFSCQAGAILGRAPERAQAALCAYAADLGLAFQIQDDLLDITGDAAITGKDQGIDAVAGKATVAAVLGVEGASQRLLELRAHALAQLEAFGDVAALLCDVFSFVISRRS